MKCSTTRTVPTHRRDEGVALVLALLFVVLLTVIVVEFTYEMQVDATLIDQHTSNTVGYMAAKSSIALSMSVLAADLLFGEEEAEVQSSEVYDSLDEPWADSSPVVSLNDAMMAVQIDDEYGKINLNALLFEEGEGEVEFEPLVEALTVLFEMREMEVLPIDVILDWLDSDDETRPEGAESDYYENLETPFVCKNGPMDSIEELLLLPGITIEDYFGDTEPDAEYQLLPLNELLTVHGHPEGKVNVNTAEFEVLEAMFSADGRDPSPSEKADEVMARRDEDGPYTSLEDLRADGIIPEERDTAEDPDEADSQAYEVALFDVVSEVFRIQGDGQSESAQIRVEAFVWRDTHGSGAAQMFRIIDWRLIQ